MKKLFLRRVQSLVGSFLFAIVVVGLPLRAADPTISLHAGATFEHLQVGKVTFEKVVVRSVNARSLMISHAGGLASIRLRDLSPELQVAFGYNPEAEAAADNVLNEAQARAEQKRVLESGPKGLTSRTPSGNVAFDRLLQSFGQPPEVRAGVDLRPQFSELALNVKNQGPRPSCAVFAIVSALEYQNAQMTGKAERFSEEYLVWATNKTLNRPPRAVRAAAPTSDPDNGENLDTVDEGFALAEVVAALRAYGIPLQASMLYTFTKPGAAVDPPAAVVDEARNHRRVSVISLPGRDAAARMANLIQALDAETPVAIGLRWPSWRTLRTGYLSEQHPMAGLGHAVALVGYENKTGAIEDTVFIFKNSWGVKWGAGGYGYATYRYLSLNLLDAALLEVEPVAAFAPGIR